MPRYNRRGHDQISKPFVDLENLVGQERNARLRYGDLKAKKQLHGEDALGPPDESFRDVVFDPFQKPTNIAVLDALRPVPKSAVLYHEAKLPYKLGRPTTYGVFTDAHHQDVRRDDQPILEEDSALY